MNSQANQEVVKELLSRGIERVYPSGEFLEKLLLSGKKLRIYWGTDPTSTHLHIGHAASLFVLKRLQDLGHEIIFLIGDFTAKIGDPTDKKSARQPLTDKEIKNNLKSFKDQVSKIISFKGKNSAQVMFNSKWLSKMSFADVLDLSSKVTVQQMLHRDMFQERIKAEMLCVETNSNFFIQTQTDFRRNGDKLDIEMRGSEFFCPQCKKKVTAQDLSEGNHKMIRLPKPIYINEFLYPLMQGYDSVMMDVDGEIGGNDQTFNMLVGRDLMRIYKNKEKFVIAVKLLTNSEGKKMSKTEGDLINLDDEPKDMFGKVMAMSDGVMFSVAELSTSMTQSELENLRESIKNGVNPRDVKARIARWVVQTYHGEEAALKAEAEFNRVFKSKELPEDIREVRIGKKELSIIDLLIESKLVSSKSEARRLIEQGGVKVDGMKVSEVNLVVPITSKGILLQAGKRHFVRVT